MCDDYRCVWPAVKDLNPWCMLVANEIVLCTTRREELEQTFELKSRCELQKPGAEISRKKIKYFRFNRGEDSDTKQQGDEGNGVIAFTYLGSTVAEDGDL